MAKNKPDSAKAGDENFAFLAVLFPLHALSSSSCSPEQPCSITMCLVSKGRGHGKVPDQLLRIPSLPLGSRLRPLWLFLVICCWPADRQPLTMLLSPVSESIFTQLPALDVNPG
ncbi:hypothetical protein KIL84_004573 [Mauremys mutica]|uniref:Uncharacterized protein n=1 Tax=Mauremys mutica TaxID=74926 RepID=A0A9D3XP93_9SAUR|nr:hypothetical protein KIL84_004573 [Mauremys mutica]